MTGLIGQPLIVEEEEKNMFVQWQCPKCGTLSSYEIKDKENIRRINEGYSYVVLHECYYPRCSSCRESFQLYLQDGKIIAK